MPRRRPRVVAVGDAIVDLVTPPMARFPAGDHQAEVARFDPLPGGNATNFALQAASLGATTTFLGAVGCDPNAEVLRRAYVRHGVRAILRRDPRRPTGTTVSLTWSGGGRTLITAPGANVGLRLRDVPIPVLRRADHLHRAGFWWTSGLVGRPTASILARARQFGATTSLDVSTDPRGWPASRVTAVRACLPHVDTFFGNETEVCALAGLRSPRQAARRLCALGAREVVLHQGAEGSTWVTTSDVLQSPGFDVSVDNPTGCGDVFNAAYVFSRSIGKPAAESLRFANATAALHLRDRQRPYPTLPVVRHFLRGFAHP